MIADISSIFMYCWSLLRTPFPKSRTTLVSPLSSKNPEHAPPAFGYGPLLPNTVSFKQIPPLIKIP
jgi:hypothetical protein